MVMSGPKTRIPISPIIVVKGIKALDEKLGLCLEKKFEDKLVGNLQLSVEELRDAVLACLDETGFFNDKMKEIEQLVDEAKEVFLEAEDASAEAFKRDVARNIIEFGDTPEMAYRNAVDSWVDDIGAEEWDDEEDDEEDWDEEEEEA